MKVETMHKMYIFYVLQLKIEIYMDVLSEK